MSLNLHNDSNVYILGAGFSREAGLPLVSDFLIRLRDSHPWLQKEGRLEEAESVAKVLQYRLDAASAAYWTKLDLENIEELFSLASSTSGNLSQHIQTAIAATLDYAFTATGGNPPIYLSSSDHEYDWLAKAPWTSPAPQAIRDTIRNPYAVRLYSYYIAQLLGMLNDGHAQGENTFISFNYDTLLEDSLSDLGITFGYGLHKGAATSDVSAQAQRGEYQVEVLKLHGSINWGRRGKRTRRLTQYGSYADLRNDGAAPELIPPTWKKVFQDQLAQVWDASVQALRNATRIIVIGFSIPPTDLHFKYLMAAGLKDNLSLRKIVFINPAAEALKHRARDLFNPHYLENGLIEFQPLTLKGLCEHGNQLKELGRPMLGIFAHRIP
ncbi:MAG: hypothetical protein E6R07_13415 [Nevskiaceae bacterium]|nr:MAG: hypothetical protein E6R07_13415 [Nevskiaceae bacterium]